MSVIATLNNMEWNAWYYNSRSPWHRRLIFWRESVCVYFLSNKWIYNCQCPIPSKTNPFCISSDIRNSASESNAQATMILSQKEKENFSRIFDALIKISCVNSRTVYFLYKESIRIGSVLLKILPF